MSPVSKRQSNRGSKLAKVREQRCCCGDGAVESCVQANTIRSEPGSAGEGCTTRKVQLSGVTGGGDLYQVFTLSTAVLNFY